MLIRIVARCDLVCYMYLYIISNFINYRDPPRARTTAAACAPGFQESSGDASAGLVEVNQNCSGAPVRSGARLALPRCRRRSATSDVIGDYARRTSIILFQLPAHWRSARSVVSHAVAAACTCARARNAVSRVQAHRSFGAARRAAAQELHTRLRLELDAVPRVRRVARVDHRAVCTCKV